MQTYETLNDNTLDKCFAEFPKLEVKKSVEETNKLFQPYLFFHKGSKEIELWSSCCRKSGCMPYPPRTVTTVEQRILEGKHNEYAICPYCGKRVILKNIKHLGQKKNLEEYHPVVFLKAKRGNLYARCYWTLKNYKRELTEDPRYLLVGAYKFSPGKAEYYRYYGSWRKETLTGNYDPVHRVITEPFCEGTGYWYQYYTPYHVFGLEAIGKSAFKYCQFEKYEKGPMHLHMMKYLAACCIYPRAIEMLMKTGMEELVEDLVSGRRKNSQIINWKAETVTEAFGISRAELQQWRQSEAPAAAIRYYKQLKRTGLPTSFQTLAFFYDNILGYGLAEDFLKYCKKLQLKPEKLVNYLVKKTASFDVKHRSIGATANLWKDYADMIGQLGYDLTEETVIFPKDLQRKHDEAAVEINLMHEREKAEQNRLLRMEAQLRFDKWREKYNFERDGYFIRIAESVEEIVTEGKTLCHCVGGYAERHMKGSLTILFLRRCETPDASLYTVEMHGDRLIQIHGYKNEMLGAPDPRKTMDWFLSSWQDWLRCGSPRDESGKPKIRERMATA